jgi:UDP-N-acetylglucosamine diphosphorylase/glucosamine-1-phosphate N-acetyltransferase
MRICLFEDARWRRLLPLTWLHPVWELRFGAFSVLTRVRALEDAVSERFHCRSWLSRVSQERIGLFPAKTAESGTLYLNGRIVDVEGVVRDIGIPQNGFTLWSRDDLVAFYLDHAMPSLPAPEDLNAWARELPLPRRTMKAHLFEYWWDLLSLNDATLRHDASRFELGANHGSIASGAHVLESAQVYVAARTVVDPGAVIDARDGPVVLEEDSLVGSNAVIKGPVHVGRDCLIKPCAQVGPNVSLGPQSRVAGEINDTIFLGRSNKQHYGFFGHGYVGEWVNLGAGTTNSNLKNTYDKVKVWVDGTAIDSGQTFLGCAIGDHTKTAIGTVINTGSVIGVASNVFGHGFPPRFVPSFSWGFAGERVNNLRMVFAAAAKGMERRGRALTEAEIELLNRVFQMTERERHRR